VSGGKNLFRATKRKVVEPTPPLFEVEDSVKPDELRRENDYYPTIQTEPTHALLARDGERIRELGGVWEPACGKGDIVHTIRAAGIPCSASDLVLRGCPDSWQADFFSCFRSRAKAIITNPPFNLINARDGKGAWLRHSLDMPDWRYMALLLSWDWPAGRTNGLGALLDANPFSYCYLMRWKVDFTGQGNPPNRNAWFVWDRDDPRSYDGRHPEPSFRLLDREDGRQQELQLTPTTGAPS
jgi:hypothetical protein